MAAEEETQALSFLVAGGGGGGASSFDACNRILADLCTTGNPKEGAALALRKYVEEEARELGNEVFSRFMDQLYDRITSLLESNDPTDNFGALRVIDELIDVPLGEDASKVSRFSNYMEIVFEGKRDERILVLASNVLGHLARAGGAMAADEHEEFDIEGCLQKRPPLILGGASAPKLSWRPATERIRDPLNNTENDSYENETDFHKVRQKTTTKETEGGRSSDLIPNRQSQPTPLVGRWGFFWELDGRKPDGKVIWNAWISFGERPPKVFNTYYTIKEYEEYKVDVNNDEDEKGDNGEEEEEEEEEEEDYEGEDVDYETVANDLHNVDALKFLCYPINDIFHFVLFDLLKFISTIPPPSTIVFVSGNAAFAPFLCKVKEKGYQVLVVSHSERASSAFQDAGLTLYDWIRVINGEGFFPLEERGLPVSKKRDYASLSL